MSLSADTVARAIVAAARVLHLDPLEVLSGDRRFAKGRIVAGAVLVHAGACSAAQAARVCGAPTAQKLAPTGRAKYGIAEADFQRAIALAGLVAPPSAPVVLVRKEGAAFSPSLRAPQMQAVEAYLRSVADAEGCVIGKAMPVISAGSGVPLGSVHFAIKGLEEAGRVAVSKAFRPGSMAPAPNSYRLTTTAPKPPEPPKRPDKRQPDPVFAAAFESRKPAANAVRATAHPAPAKLAAAAALDVADFQTDEPITRGPAILTRLRHGQCRWPLENSPTGADQLYCAAACDAGQYCSRHLDRMWAKPPKREAKPLADAERDRRAQTARDRRSA